MISSNIRFDFSIRSVTSKEHTGQEFFMVMYFRMQSEQTRYKMQIIRTDE